MIDHLYRDGGQYDRLLDRAIADLPFWKEQAATAGDPVLELGCGTGRVAIPLARAGSNVTGIDNSEGMLAEACRKSASAAVDVQWIKADMRGFNLGSVYALIFIPNNTLCHLLTRGDFEACLASVRQHMAPGGRFVIDVFVPKMALLVDTGGERVPFSECDDPGGRGRITVRESYVYEPDTQIKRVTYWYKAPGQEHELPGALNLRMYFPQELDALITYNGFKIESKFGTYDGAAFDATSEKQIVMCSVA
jgi:SAM-dependent methyltransferase